MSVRLHIVAEGQTEERFVNDYLVEYLSKKNVFADVRVVETSRKKIKKKHGKKEIITHKGGGRSIFKHLFKDIKSWINDDHNPGSWFTTFIDLYGLKRASNKPDGYSDCDNINDPYKKVKCIESLIEKEIHHSRFIPFIQLHEFETFLLCDPDLLTQEFPHQAFNVQKLKQSLKAELDNPELINEGEETAPSKRIIRHIAEYEGRKVSSGPIIAGRIGIDNLRKKCPHFHDWLTKLEGLSS